MVKYLLFDLDGTLTDPKEGITNSVAYALEKYGITVKDHDELIPFIGPPLYDSFERFYGFSHEKAIEAVEFYREYFRPYGMFENYVYPGIPEMLAKFKAAGFKMAVASSKPEVFVKKITEKFGLDVFFEEQIGSELDGSRIEKVDVIKDALKRLGSKPGEALMIGDKSHDVSGAKAAGVKAAGVCWGYALEGELEASKPDFTAKSIKDLQEYVLNINTL